MKLTYTGNGQVIPHVEPRDLSVDDIQVLIKVKRLFRDENEAIEALTRRGIYSLAKAPKRSIKEDIVEITEDES